jgi:hypothetical protein
LAAGDHVFVSEDDDFQMCRACACGEETMTDTRPEHKAQVHKLPDGAVAVYLDADWRPTTPAGAVYVKVIYADGRVEFGIASDKDSELP